MIPIEQTAAVLLCAGLSERFGEGNKLLEPLDGKPLVHHAADLLRSLPFARRIAVIGSDDLSSLLQGFELVPNPRPSDGQDSSVRLGITAALAAETKAVLICLADMPHVPTSHIRKLSLAADPATAAMSWDGEHRSPPVLIPAAICSLVLEDPYRAVRSLLTAVAEVEAPAGTLRDFDTRADFRR